MEQRGFFDSLTHSQLSLQRLGSEDSGAAQDFSVQKREVILRLIQDWALVHIIYISYCYLPLYNGILVMSPLSCHLYTLTVL